MFQAVTQTSAWVQYKNMLLNSQLNSKGNTMHAVCKMIV